ncbi:hypothetical protein, partial [Fischerella muscicola]
AEGRRQKAEGRRQRAEGWKYLYHEHWYTTTHENSYPLCHLPCHVLLCGKPSCGRLQVGEAAQRSGSSA